MRQNVRAGYWMRVDNRYQDFEDSTYEDFLTLARRFDPSCQTLADDGLIDQLQGLYYLLQEGVLQIRRHELKAGGIVLFLQVKT